MTYFMAVEVNPKAVLAGKKSAVSRKYNKRIAEASSKAQAGSLKAAKTRKLKALDASFAG